MRKQIQYALTTLLISSVILASPVKNMPTKITQPDGQIINCFVTGDEYYHWLHDKDGYTIIKDNASGYYVWAMKDGDNLIASKYVVGKTDPNTLNIEKWLNISAQKVTQKRIKATQSITSTKNTNAPCPTKGIINNLVVFIRFSDQSEFTNDYQFYNSTFNDSSSTARSLYNYYKEVSYNKLFIRSHIFQKSSNNTIVSYQDSRPRSYYTTVAEGNPDGYSDGEAYQRERELLANVLQSISSQIPSNINFDSDNDGAIDNVCFIVRGSETSWASLLWPHMSSLMGNVSINGKKVYMYNFQMETFGSCAMDIKVLAHEMFHSMGAPDLYHYKVENGAKLLMPVGDWDIMSTNSYNNAPHMGAYMKYKYGKWISDIPEIKAEGTYSLYPLVSPSNNCFKIASPNTKNQFFILEYRKMQGIFDNCDNSSYRQGLLVYRIDTTNGLTGNAWGPPDEIYIYRLDGTTTYDGNHWYAGMSKNIGRIAINNTTNPSCFLQDGSPGGLNISNVGDVLSTISFDVSFKYVASIKLTSPSQYVNLEVGQTIPINWESDGVAKVNLEYSTDLGVSWITIASSIEGDNFNWKVPNTPSTRCILKVSDSIDKQTNAQIQFYISNQSDFYPIQTNFSMSPIYKCDTYNGVTLVENEFWIHLWKTSKIYRVDHNGVLIGELKTPFLSSLSYDRKRYVYAVKYGGDMKTIFKFDSNSMTIVDSIKSPVSTLYCSYDPTADNNRGGLWVGWDSDLMDINLISLDGRILKTISTKILNLPSICGIAFDDYSSGGPYLWFFDKGKGYGYPQIIYKFNLANNTFIAKFHDVSKDFGMDVYQVGAGLSITDKLEKNKISLCGVYTVYMESKVFAYDVSSGRVIKPDNLVSSEISAQKISLNWNDNSDNENGFIIERKKSGGKDFSSLTKVNANATDYVDETLEKGFVYYYRVKAYNQEVESDCSNEVVFSTVPIPQKPIIASLNNTINQPLTITLKWNKVDYSNKYFLQLSKEQAFASIVKNDSTTTDTLKTIAGLENNTKYYWRVRAKNVAGLSNWSDVYSFTTIIALPATPILATINNTVNQPIDVALKWNKVSCAEKYFIQLSTNQSFSSLAMNDSTTTDTVKTISGLENNTKYYWRVRAKNIAGNGEWSDVWNFTTIVALPIKPVLVLQNNLIDQPTNMMLKWYKVEFADKYYMQLSSDQSFNTLIRSDSTLADTTIMIRRLNNGTKYYWRVCAKNILGYGDWSDIYDLTTILTSPTNLVIERSGLKEITLSWNDNSSDEEGYIIERKQNAQTTFSVIDTLKGSGNKYIDKTVEQTFTYTYRTKAYTKFAESIYSNEAIIIVVAVEEEKKPTEYTLSQNYPNPFNPTTVFRFGLPQESRVVLSVYNILGQVVSELVNEIKPIGYYNINWNAANYSSGVYMYKIEANPTNGEKAFILIRKMIYMK